MFRAIGLVLSWLPVIISTITAVEQIVGSGNGTQKKEIVTQAIYRILDKAGVSLSGPVRTIISAVIDALVAVLNILGVAGFSDEKDNPATVELLPSVYAQEIAEREAAERAAAEEAETPVEPQAKASPDEERMNELEELLEARAAEAEEGLTE